MQSPSFLVETLCEVFEVLRGGRSPLFMYNYLFCNGHMVWGHGFCSMQPMGALVYIEAL